MMAPVVVYGKQCTWRFDSSDAGGPQFLFLRQAARLAGRVVAQNGLTRMGTLVGLLVIMLPLLAAHLSFFLFLFH